MQQACPVVQVHLVLPDVGVTDGTAGFAYRATTAGVCTECSHLSWHLVYQV